jgi:hypothetical protein
MGLPPNFLPIVISQYKIKLPHRKNTNLNKH